MRKNPAILLALAVLALLPVDVFGQAPAAFSRMGFGARGIGLSNALVADAMGDGSPYYNPALAPFATGQSLEASAAVLSFDRRLQFLQFATPIRPSAGVAAGLIHASVSNIDGRDESGYHMESYSIDEFAFFLSFGTRIGERITAGIGLQLFRADYFDELKPVNSIGIDAGLTYSATEDLRLGLAVDDLLARYSWDTSDLYGSGGKTTSDRFPVRLRVGAAYRLMDGKAQVLAEYESRVTSYEYRTREVVLVGDVPQEETTSKRASIQEKRARVGLEYHHSDNFAVRGRI
ncbi:MAG: hypothetical protein WD275_01405, partial [Rhodothermales bacterium]